jgi:hypothetical protein
MPNNAVVVVVVVDGRCLDVVVVISFVIGVAALLFGEYDQDSTNIILWCPLFLCFPSCSSSSDNKKNVVTTNKEEKTDAERQQRRQDSE